MPIVRVNPGSVRLYAEQASQQFAACRSQLEGLVRSAVEVHYFGRNASDFKKACGAMAAQYSSDLLRDLEQIAEAVRGSTSNIASSLGGAPVTIAVDGTPVAVPPVPEADEVVDVDMSALDALKPVVSQHIAAVHAALDEHLRALTATDWEGAAKIAAVDAVSTFTKAAQSKATEANDKITAFISAQIESVTAADR